MMLEKINSRALKTKRRGFTLMELAIVLAVMGAVTGGIWAASAAAYQHYKVSRGLEQLQQIVDNVRTHYNTASQLPAQDFTTFTQTMAQADVFPAEIKLSPNVAPAACATCYFVNPWSAGSGGSVCGGGAVCLAASDGSMFGGAAARYSFVVVLRDLPQDACITFASKLTAIWDDIGLRALGMDVANVVVPGTVFAAPPNPTALAAACSGVALNHLYFMFRLQAA